MTTRTTESHCHQSFPFSLCSLIGCLNYFICLHVGTSILLHTQASLINICSCGTAIRIMPYSFPPRVRPAHWRNSLPEPRPASPSVRLTSIPRTLMTAKKCGFLLPWQTTLGSLIWPYGASPIADPTAGFPEGMYPISGGQVTGSGGNAELEDAPPAYAFDGDEQNRWVDINGGGIGNISWLAYEHTEPVMVMEYTITSQMYALSSYHSHLNGAPRDWTLKACKENGDWEEIDRQTHIYFSGHRQTQKFVVAKPIIAQKYMLEFTAVAAGCASRSIQVLLPAHLGYGTGPPLGVLRGGRLGWVLGQDRVTNWYDHPLDITLEPRMQEDADAPVVTTNMLVVRPRKDVIIADKVHQHPKIEKQENYRAKIEVRTMFRKAPAAGLQVRQATFLASPCNYAYCVITILEAW
eukprot:scaffold152523_cov19-Tisochrysis_lutea.AAC.1